MVACNLLIHLSIYQCLLKVSKYGLKNDEFLEATASELSLVERKMFIQASEREPVLLKFIFDRFKTQEICGKAIAVKGWTLCFVTDHFKSLEMCEAIEEDPWSLANVPDHIKNQEICRRVVEEDPYMLKSVLD